MLILTLGLILTIALLVPNVRSRWYVLYAILLLALAWGIPEIFPNRGYAEFKFTSLSLRYIAPVLLLHLLVINIVTWIAYAADKRAARKRGWRVAERTLLALAFIGGTPAAFAAKKILRHKIGKKTFRQRFWLVVILQIVVVIFVLTL